MSFTGASRRLEYKGLFNGARVYDDYGHHPTEIKATVDGIKHMKHNASWVVFEAHTFSRLKAHLEEFADSLAAFDNIIVMDIYAAREVNTFNISENDIIEALEKRNKKAVHISKYEEIVDYLKDKVQDNDIILTLGAGNVTKIATLLTK
jgi:UDP-N-acetylmuramate--alanine ligase